MNHRFRSDESGAVAVIVAICSILLLVMGAFAVDVGNAYAQNRQISVAADAAALGAAAKVGEALPIGATCTGSTLTSINATALATTTANQINTQNLRSGSENVTSVAVSCADTFVEVTVANRRSVPTTFGKVIGIGDLQPNQTATARYVRTTVAGGLRPWAVCDGTAQLAQQAPNVTFATGLDNKVGVCSAGPTSGNWGSVDFNGGGNSAGDLADWTLDGYPGPVVLPDAFLPADPGVSNSADLGTAFTALVNQVVLFPTVTQCNGPCNGNGATFDAVGIMTAKVCGVRYANTIYNTGSDCWSSAVEAALPTQSNGRPIDHIQFRWVNYTTSSYPGANQADDCSLADRQCVGSTRLWR